MSESESYDDLRGPDADLPATYKEIRGWYMYDWANSPYFQVYVSSLMPILLKWLAEGYAIEESGIDAFVNGTFNDDIAMENLTMPGLGITAGSYPALINWITYALQVVCLLSFSAFGDFGSRRLRLLKIMTFYGSFVLILYIFCWSSSTWWLAGVLRILAGVAFVLAGVYYNAYLPLLVKAHPEVVGKDVDRAEQELTVADDMSTKGQSIGYCGGVIMLIISWVLVLIFECDPKQEECANFSRYFLPSICIFLVGFWWAGFSLITFKNLQTRPGEELPADTNLICFGWSQACDTLCYICSIRNTLLYIVFYFLSSDAIATTTNVALLLLEDGCPSEGSVTSLSSILLNSILAALGAFIGIFLIRGVQCCTGGSAKAILIGMLAVYSIVSILGGLAFCSIATALNGVGFYLIMAPLMLLLGPVQALSRSIYCSFIPKGRESAMFAFFEITDKGSNLIGTAVIFVVHNVTKSYVGTFWYLALAFGACVLILFCVNVDGLAPEEESDSEFSS